MLTFNRDEEKLPPMRWLDGGTPKNLMFIRLRVSDTNLDLIDAQVRRLCRHAPIVLTFMAYYTDSPRAQELYTWRKRDLNSYWCATPGFMQSVLKREKAIGGRMVTMCTGLKSTRCVDCRNCETYYWQTLKRMRGE